MKIKKITIQNFRSYYKVVPIIIGEGLTLIIGSNGDGKTTLFDALQWLMNDVPDGQFEMQKNISRKRMSELCEDESDDVIVQMDFEHFDNSYVLVKKYTFSKGLNGIVNCFNPSRELYQDLGSERSIIQNGGNFFNKNIFDSSIRRYCLFKGESELNVFNKEEALDLLIQTFSNISSFDKYIEASGHCKSMSAKAVDAVLRQNKSSQKRIDSLNSDINNNRRERDKKATELRYLEKESSNYERLISGISNQRELSSLLKTCNKRIESLQNSKRVASTRIKENYSHRLLDEMWILRGFSPIAKEYSEKVNSLRKQKTKEEREFLKQIGAREREEQFKIQLKNGAVPLAPYIPNETVMRDMLNDHICKVCGTLAPEGSEPYKFMEQKLQEYLDSIRKPVDNEEEQLFPFDFISELDKRNTLLDNKRDFFENLATEIKEDILFNEKRNTEVAKIEAEIQAEEEKKKEILAQTDIDEISLVNAFDNMTNWWEAKNQADVKIAKLKNDIAELDADYEKLEADRHGIAIKSVAGTYEKISKALGLVNECFIAAKEMNKTMFLRDLEKIANQYLEKLNDGDFRGLIWVHEDKGSVELSLVDESKNVISDPNTALKTTMYMSVLFAIAELTEKKKEDNYPLIFDAPTSSFTNAKENDFFRLIGNINKQVIIVTKSFLVEDANKNNIVDKSKLASINGLMYRIEKRKPFNPVDLSTIQTFISNIQI